MRDIVGDGNGKVSDADACRGVAVHQCIVRAEAVFAGTVFAVAAVGAEADGRRDECPVEVIPAAQFGQKVARGVGAVVDFFGEIRGIDDLHAGGDVEAARAADDEQVRYARAFGGGEDGGVAVAEIATNIRIGPAGVEGADDGIKSGELLGKTGGGDIGGNGAHVWRGEDFAGVAGEGGNVVAARGEFLDDGVADVAGSADNGEFHGVLLGFVKERLFYPRREAVRIAVF